MDKLHIPFQPEFKALMLSGKKTATTRPKRYGYPGDRFPAFGRTFVLTQVQRVYLDIVAHYHYLEEGFNSFDEFVNYWNRLHPRRTYQKEPTRVVFFHIFNLDNGRNET